MVRPSLRGEVGGGVEENGADRGEGVRLQSVGRHPSLARFSWREAKTQRSVVAARRGPGLAATLGNVTALGGAGRVGVRRKRQK